MKVLVQIAAVALVLSLGLVVGQVYRWWMAPSGIEVRSMDLGAIGLTDDKPVIVSLSTCPVCATARRWMQDNGIEFTELVVEASAVNRSAG